jgi:hypothetical protein
VMRGAVKTVARHAPVAPGAGVAIRLEISEEWVRGEPALKTDFVLRAGRLLNINDNLLPAINTRCF